MRLFIAVRFEDNVIKSLTAAQDALRIRDYSGQYTKPQNMHLTLSFIGEYTDPDHVLDIMKAVMTEPFTLTLSSKIGNFGDLLWAGAEQTPELMAFSAKLRDALDAGGVPHDKLPFIPHITLLQRARGSETYENITLAPTEMTVKGITLMRSDLSREDLGIYQEIGSATV